jgi:hypothetical protein
VDPPDQTAESGLDLAEDPQRRVPVERLPRTVQQL